jgi:hypothetical protein
MTPVETEQGRMSLWDKALTATLNMGKPIEEAIHAAEKAVDAFEARFHADLVKFRKELGGVQAKETEPNAHEQSNT